MTYVNCPQLFVSGNLSKYEEARGDIQKLARSQHNLTDGICWSLDYFTNYFCTTLH